MKPELHERKWEIDSLCYPVRLAYHYWKKSNDSSVFTTKWEQAARSILLTFKDQQKKSGKGSYSFMRKTEIPSDTQFGLGFGLPVKPVGLICSAFRPSDDATFFQFLIPSNYFAVVSLHQIAEIASKVLKDLPLAAEATALAAEVDAALKKYGVGIHPTAGKIIPLRSGRIWQQPVYGRHQYSQSVGPAIPWGHFGFRCLVSGHPKICFK